MKLLFMVVCCLVLTSIFCSNEANAKVTVTPKEHQCIHDVIKNMTMSNMVAQIIGQQTDNPISINNAILSNNVTRAVAGVENCLSN